MTRTTIKKRLETILDQLLELQQDVEETRDEIEPYEGKDDLTDQQQERYDWLDELASTIDDACSNLSDYQY